MLQAVDATDVASSAPAHASNEARDATDGETADSLPYVTYLRAQARLYKLPELALARIEDLWSRLPWLVHPEVQEFLMDRRGGGLREEDARRMISMQGLDLCVPDSMQTLVSLGVSKDVAQRLLFRIQFLHPGCHVRRFSSVVRRPYGARPAGHYQPSMVP